MSTLARYTHLPLPSSNHIRLLEFPAYTDQEEPLQGTVRVVDLEESTVPYVALSYTWGQPNFSENLLLDENGILSITPNLAAALRRFRYSSALRWIWVDAICINQLDDAEKTIQIPLMGDIYRGASRVMVWLGDRAQDIDLLYQTKRLVGRMTDPREDDDFADMLVTSLSQLSRLPWFSRRWIIQELVFNPSAVLCCGQTELPWINLVPAFQVIVDKKRTDLQNIRLLWDVWGDISMPLGMRNERTDHMGLEKRGIASLMHSCSAFECTDGHDRIAALVGLSTDACKSVTVNYADSAEQTFTSFAEGLARSGHMAWLIYQSLQRKKDPSNQGRAVPSWVPDWRIAVSIHGRNSKLDTEVYEKIPCDIQMHSASPSLHLLTAEFLVLLENTAAPNETLQLPVNFNPASLQVAWKSVLFSKDADLAERMALTLVDLWPWVLSHLSEHEMAFRHDIWFELLLWLSTALVELYHPAFSRRLLLVDAEAKRPVIPDLIQDANGLDTFRSFICDWLNVQPRWGWGKSRNKAELARIDCLIFCRQTSQSGFLTRGLPCAFGSLQLPFYHAVEIGDKVLSADLGYFHLSSSDRSSAQYNCRHIVREHPAVGDLPVLSTAQSLYDSRGANQYASREKLQEIRPHGSQGEPVPVVYEFVAPCDLLGLFPWRGLRQVEGAKGTYRAYDAVETVNKKLSVWVK